MQVYHLGVDTFVISRLRTKTPDIKTTSVEDRSFTFRDQEVLSVHSVVSSLMLWVCTFHRTISCLSSCGLQISPWPNLRQKFMNIWSFLTRPGDKHDEKISNCSSTPKLVQAHDSAVSLTIFKLFSRQDSQSHGFLVKYHSEMKCFFVQ